MTTEETTTRLTPGELVRDTDSNDGKLLLVVNDPEERADRYVVFPMPEGDRDITVYLYDQSYPRDARVLEVVYISELEKALESWNAEDVMEMHAEDELTDTGVKVYAFPEDRLRSATRASQT